MFGTAAKCSLTCVDARSVHFYGEFAISPLGGACDTCWEHVVYRKHAIPLGAFWSTARSMRFRYKLRYRYNACDTHAMPIEHDIRLNEWLQPGADRPTELLIITKRKLFRPRTTLPLTHCAFFVACCFSYYTYTTSYRGATSHQVERHHGDDKTHSKRVHRTHIAVISATYFANQTG